MGRSVAVHLLSVSLWLTTADAAAATTSPGTFKTINHDDVLPMTSNATSLQYDWQPWLMVTGVTCAPFPAVDAEGKVSGGLAPSGDMSDDCQFSAGQTYARTRFQNGRLDAIMWAWFFVSGHKCMREDARLTLSL